MPTRTVLVVDPSPLSARRVEEALHGTGFHVVAAGSAADAEQAVDAGEIAVALAAVSFPRGNGYDFARHVRTRNPEAVVFLLCGGFEVFNAERAEQAGVTGKINRPFTVDTLRRHLERALGPLAAGEAAPAPVDEPISLDAAEVISEPDMLPADAIQQEPAPRPAIADERLATFLPRDWRSYPPVRVDPDVVGPAVERAILEVLPEVVEAVLNKALGSSRAFRDLVEVAVDEAVRAQVGPIARRVVAERLAELEAAGDDKS